MIFYIFASADKVIRLKCIISVNMTSIHTKSIWDDSVKSKKLILTAQGFVFRKNVSFNILHAKLFSRDGKNIFAFSDISGYWKAADTWNFSLSKERTHLSYAINAMVADDLQMQEARPSAAIVLTLFSRSILAQHQ